MVIQKQNINLCQEGNKWKFFVCLRLFVVFNLFLLYLMTELVINVNLHAVEQ